MEKSCVKLLFLIVFLIQGPLVSATEIEGKLNVIWGDGPQGSSVSPIRYSLIKANNDTIQLEISDDVLEDAGGIVQLRNKHIKVHIDSLAEPSSNEQNVRMRSGKTSLEKVLSISIALDPSENSSSPRQQNAQATPLALTGSQKYVSILCKFQDVPDEPQNIGYFNNMYGNSVGQLSHYWKEVSSNKINLTGSRAYGGASGNTGWYTLPHNRSYYIDDVYGADLGALFNDCVNAADTHINFSDVKGINLMFNDDLDCCAWGGGWYEELDGVTKVWPTTWEPTWGWSSAGVMAHEMGHSFGLPHSNNSDEDDWPYDSPWSVMSDAHSSTFSDSDYTLRPQHINGYEKNILGWLNNAETYTAAPDGKTHILKIDYSNRSAATNGAYRLATIRFDRSNRYYTIEARELTPNYEGLPGTAVIIHTIDPARLEPSWIVDQAEPPADYADTGGVMWNAGEIFHDHQNGVSIKVLSQESTGFTVEITTPKLASGAFLPAIVQLLLSDVEEPEQCEYQSIGAHGTVNGAWTTNDRISKTDKPLLNSYADYYVLEVPSATGYTIDLTSSVADAYLTLRLGCNLASNPLYVSDDDGEGTNARLTIDSLPQGSYLIEATTYYQGETGDYSLSY